MGFFANLFGYLLNFIYNIIGNYGWAIIVFSIVIKIIMIPFSVKQQKTLKKNTKIQEKMKEIQFKYKNNPEMLNQATMQLYKEENLSPFSGCFSAIILILLISIFYLVRSPLTYMKKIDSDVIKKYETIVKEENLSKTSGYPEIEIIREAEKLKSIQREDINAEELEKIETNMTFLGLDLSQVPSQNTGDWKVYIIPVLYVLISFVSMKVSLGTQNKKEDKKLLTEENGKQGEGESAEETGDMQDVMNQVNKNMSMIFPIMYLSVAIIAPLGLALYWLVNSILMIAERLVLNKVIKDDK